MVQSRVRILPQTPKTICFQPLLFDGFIKVAAYISINLYHSKQDFSVVLFISRYTHGCLNGICSIIVYILHQVKYKLHSRYKSVICKNGSGIFILKTCFHDNNHSKPPTKTFRKPSKIPYRTSKIGYVSIFDIRLI